MEKSTVKVAGNEKNERFFSEIPAIFFDIFVMYGNILVKAVLC